jgi:ABC-type nitrate/sulfonate/bicarbonate transport system substrate-binding protein
LADGSDVTGPYQTFSGFARRSWAAANRERLVRLIRALVDTLDWMYQPASRPELAAIYAKYLPNLPAGVAAKHVAAMLGEREGFIRDGRLDPDGVRTVLALRSRLGTPPKRLDDPLRYQDESYYRAALAR